MVNIKIFGKNKELFDCVCKSIESYGDRLCKRRSISISTAFEGNELSAGSIAVFCGGFRGKVRGENFPAIFSSDNSGAIATLSGKSGAAISCGMSLRDTLSTSSLDDEKRMVSLQRAIRTVDGELIEPRDFYISGKGELYSRLASSAVLLLLGVIPEQGFEL